MRRKHPTILLREQTHSESKGLRRKSTWRQDVAGVEVELFAAARAVPEVVVASRLVQICLALKVQPRKCCGKQVQGNGTRQGTTKLGEGMQCLLVHTRCSRVATARLLKPREIDAARGKDVLRS